MGKFKVEVGVIGNTKHLETQLKALDNKKSINVNAKFNKAQVNSAFKQIANQEKVTYPIKVSFTPSQVRTALNDAMKKLGNFKNNKIGIASVGFDANQIRKELQKTFKNIRTKFIVNVGFSKSQVSSELKTMAKNVQGVTVPMNTKATNKIASQVNNASNSATTTEEKANGLIDKVSNWYLAQIPIRLLGTALNETKQAVVDFDASLTEFKKVSDLGGESLNEYTQRLGELGVEVGRTRAEMTDLAGEFKKSGFTDEEAQLLSKVGALYQNVADSEVTAGQSAGFITSQIRAFNMEVEEGIQVVDKVNEVSNNFSVSSTDIASGMTKQSSAFASFGNDINETIALITAGTEILTKQPGKVANGMRSIGAEIVKIANESGNLTFKVNGIDKSIKLVDDTTGKLTSTYKVLEQVSENYWNDMTEQERVNLGIMLGMKTQYNVFTATLNNFNKAQESYKTALTSNGSAIKENSKYMESLEAKMSRLKSAFSEIVLGDGGLGAFTKTLVDLSSGVLKLFNNDVARTILTLSSFSLGIIAVTKAIEKLKATAVFTGIVNGLKGLKNNISAFGEVYKITKGGYLSTGMNRASASFKAFGNTASMVSAGISTTTKILGGLAIGLTAFTLITERVKKAKEEEKQALEETKTKYNEHSNELEKLKDKLKQNESELKRNTDAIKERNNTSISSKKNIENLQKENEELKKNIELEEELKFINLEKLHEQQKKSLGIKTEYPWYQFGGVGGFGSNTRAENYGNPYFFGDDLSKYGFEEKIGGGIEDTLAKKLEHPDNDNLEEYSLSIETLCERLKRLEEIERELLEAGKEDEEITKMLQSQISNIKTTLADTASEFKNNKETTDELADAYKSVGKDATELEKESSVLGKTIDTISEAFGDYNTNVVDTQVQVDDLVNNYANLQNEATNLNTELDNMQSAWETLSSAQDSYNQNGYITLDQLQAITSISPQILACLIDENGQLQLNQEGFDNLTNAIIGNKVQQLEAAAAMEIAQLAGVNLSEAELVAQIGAGNLSGAISGAGQTAIAQAGNIEQFTSSIRDMLKTVNVNVDGVKQEDVQKIAQKYYNVAKSITSIGKSAIGNSKAISNNTSSAKKNTGAHKGNTGARKNNTSAIDKQTEALKKQKEQLENEKKALEDKKKDYENTYKYLEYLADKELERLEKNQKAEEKAVNDKYDKLTKPLEKNIKKLEDRDYILEKEVEKLQEQADIQLKALEKENTELDRMVEKEKLLLELAKAKEQHKMVYRDGVGFVFESDANAVSDASRNLYEFELNNKYEDSKKAIQDSVDNSAQNIELKKNKKMLEEMEHSLEEYEDKREEALDKIDKKYETATEKVNNYLNELKKMQDKYEIMLEKTSAEKILGGHIKVWQQKTSDLNKLTSNYVKLLSQIDAKTKQIDSVSKKLSSLQSQAKATQSAVSSVGSGGGSGGIALASSSSSKKSSEPKIYSSVALRSSKYRTKKEAENYAKKVKSSTPKGNIGVMKTSDGYYIVVQYLPNVSKNKVQSSYAKNTTLKNAQNSVSYYAGHKNNSIFGKYKNNAIMLVDKTGHIYTRLATGTSSLGKNQLALVGDSPNKELVIGSKLNGQMMNLEKGTGVVNAKSTNTLAGILNSLSSAMHINNTPMNNLSTNSGQIINIDNISLPQVNNGKDFINYLRNFRNDLKKNI